MKALFVASVTPPPERDEPAWWFIFNERKMLVTLSDGKATVPILRSVGDIGLHPFRELYLGTFDKAHCYAVELDSTPQIPQGMSLQGLRSLHGRLDDDLLKLAFRAIHVIEWDRTDRFCSRCGAKNVSKEGIRAKECPQCGALSFPRMSPAIIVLVEKGNQVLLARATRFTEEIYSVLAGFVEPGETLEDVVRREVREETGIDVKDIRYFGSQPWPFPDSLMIGFTAQYAGGEILVDGDEIMDAQWFDWDKLPNIPGKISIARALIDWFVSKSAGNT